MGHSYHSRFSDMKRRRRDETKKRKMSKVQKRKQTTNQTSHSPQEVLRQSSDSTNTADLSGMPQQTGEDDTRETTARSGVLLESNLHILGSQPCPCCGLVWQPEVCRECERPVYSGMFKVHDRIYHTLCLIKMCKGET